MGGDVIGNIVIDGGGDSGGCGGDRAADVVNNCGDVS